MKTKRVISIILSATMLIGLLAMNSYAAVENHHVKSIYEDEEYGVTHEGCIYYKRDGTHITEAYAVSDYFGSTTTPMTGEEVTQINTLKYTLSDRTTQTRTSIGLPFRMNAQSHYGETGMINYPFTFSTNQDVTQLRGTFAIYTYDSYVTTHPSSSEELVLKHIAVMSN